MNEVEQLRTEIFELYALAKSVVERGGDPILVEACKEAILERLERLQTLQPGTQPPS